MECYEVQNMMRTGFPDGKYPVEETCENCGDGVDKHIEFDDVKFCNVKCLGEYMVEQGYANVSK
ncbi:hypothetical protein R6U77_00915 [Lysinibacillus louembei]|uniref:GapA-binding peptide SR1P n=1 Tax=Lysinibacillus louembei TaxID=1470088 RepID=A0ABZ0RXR8_9BACI|nr:hypothetical protein [Lysinibacillus louembei]WPK12280.1 hypothetical protein R6U77_00915 [Lysinibacillus louembei]